MGPCASKKGGLSAAKYKVSDSHFNALVSFQAELKLSDSHIDRVHRLFRGIDRDNSGRISLREFLAHLEESPTPFLEKCFLLADNDMSGQLDFVEFLAAVYHYCTFDWAGLVRYAFDASDVNRNGVLETAELAALIRSAHHGKEADALVQKVLHGMNEDGSGCVSYDEFLNRNRHFPSLLYPGFSVQAKLRKKCLGEAFWRAREGLGHQQLIAATINAMDADASDAAVAAWRSSVRDEPAAPGDPARAERDAAREQISLSPTLPSSPASPVTSPVGHRLSAGAEKAAKKRESFEKGKAHEHAASPHGEERKKRPSKTDEPERQRRPSKTDAEGDPRPRRPSKTSKTDEPETGRPRRPSKTDAEGDPRPRRPSKTSKTDEPEGSRPRRPSQTDETLRERRPSKTRVAAVG